MNFQHTSVLLSESLDLLSGVPGTRFIDGTVGGAGHASALLARRPDAEVLGIDRDPLALAAANEAFSAFSGRGTAVKGSYSEMQQLAMAHGWEQVDGIFLDLGISSPQIDTPERGFSFRFNGPLDMRMDPGASLTASVILNEYSETEIADILFQYGEERKSRQIARAVVARRQEKPFVETADFAALVNRVVGYSHQHGLPPATRSFQALRIAVNDELGELKRGLAAARDLLVPGGRLVIITFHSLEDRLVKHFFLQEEAECICPPGLPVCTCGKKSTMEILTRHPVRPTEEEVRKNPRSSCAKLRAAAKKGK